VSVSSSDDCCLVINADLRFTFIRNVCFQSCKIWSDEPCSKPCQIYCVFDSILNESLHFANVFSFLFCILTTCSERVKMYCLAPLPSSVSVYISESSLYYIVCLFYVVVVGLFVFVFFLSISNFLLLFVSCVDKSSCGSFPQRYIAHVNFTNHACFCILRNHTALVSGL